MSTLQLVLPLFMLIGTGYLLKLRQLMPQEFARHLSRLLIHAFLPALLIREMSDIALHAIDLGLAAIGFVTVVLVIVGTSFMLSLRMKKSARGAFIQCSFRSNIAYFGIPVVTAVGGDAAMQVAAPILALAVVLHIGLTIVLLQLLNPDSEGFDPTAQAKSLLTNPLILAVLIGLAVSWSGIRIPTAIDSALGLLGDASVPVALLAIGLSISLKQLRGDLHLALIAAALKLFVMPAVAYVVMLFVLRADHFLTTTMVLLLSSPTAIMALPFAQAFNSDEQMTAGAVSVANVGGIVAIPFWTLILLP